ncbi:hypothetical protein [Bosea rubneri]|uniref:Uncharacterized protein n=1 Tax=Bosea rubneri TaxID=3075434 RepID=A0ABU3S733_9HYPH|nr:hypothetical protein [Bosea sp. ZW T0_25]MDU0340182.1 hypothetical protein [Bosea sp. ZW T0_25]
MFAIAQNRRRLTALAAPFIAAALLGAPNVQAPTAPNPHPIAAQHSATGKIIDRLPGNASAPPKFETHLARAEWALAAMPHTNIAFAAEPMRSTSAAAATVSKPVAIMAASPARPHKASPVIATLPPRRPVSFNAPQGPVQIAAPQQKRPSVTSRMFAFVGSLAGLANLL